MKKLPDSNKIKLETPYTLEELEVAIKSSKPNKAPRLDGFSNEFFKSFMDELTLCTVYFTECTK